MVRIPTVEADKPYAIVTRPEASRRVWGAVGRLGDQAQRLGLLIAKQEGELRQKKKALATATELASVEVDLAAANEDIVIELRRDPNPDTYFQDWQDRFTDASIDRISRIADPDIRAKADIVAKKVQVRELIEQKHYANKLWVEVMQSKTMRLLDAYEKRGDLDSGLALLDEVGLYGIYPMDVIEKMKETYEKEVEKEKEKALVAQAGMDIWQNPYMAADLLQNFPYDKIPEDKKLILLKKAETQVNKMEKEAEKAAIEMSAQLYATLVERMRGGEDVLSEIYDHGPAGDKSLTKVDFNALLSRVDATEKAGLVSDPDTLLDVMIRSNTAVPRIREEEIIQFMKVGKLTAQDGNNALDQIRTTNASLRSEAMRLVNQEYADAEQHIREGMGISGLVLQITEKIDPTQQGLIARANAELWERSKGRGGDENPMDVAREILPKYRRALTGQNLLSIKTYEKLIEIDKYPDEHSLWFALFNDEITEADYYRKLDAFREMEEKVRLNETLKAIQEQEQWERK